jgi:putative Flp pilus-assembly TadE/G-like protein
MNTMKRSLERGQALIIIALAAIGLFGITGLAIDGSAKFSDRRHAQNAADTAALAASLAKVKGDTAWKLSGLDRALSNGYDNNLVGNTVTVYSCNEAGSDCGHNAGDSNYVRVVINSNVNTTFARVIGINQTHNTVEAIALSKSGYSGPAFSGNSLVSLALSGNGYDAHGTPVWTITNGGIMVNSSSSSSATCGGSAGVISPSVTTVANTTGFSCHTVTVGSITTGATQLTYSDYSSWFPRQPACNGTATLSGGQWQTQSGADGSRVAWTGTADFAPGLYCVTNSPGSFNGQITGTGVTFFITRSNFSMRFNGGGNLTASAPTTGEYANILMYLAPQVDANGNLANTQGLDMRGNGTGDIVGTIIAPSASVTMFGNSGSEYNSQVIGYNIDSGGTADITVSYNSGNNWYLNLPPQVGLFQ